MRQYVVIDTSTGIVDSIMQWGDDRDLPLDWEVELNQTVVTIDDSVVIDIGNKYDMETGVITVLPYVAPILLPTEVELLRAELAEAQEAINYILMTY